MSGSNAFAWSTTAANNASVGSVNFAESQLPSTVNDSARALMADVRATINTIAGGWAEYGDGDATYTATYVSGTSFKFSGVDLTSVYHVGRRIKLTAATPGTIYGTIATSAFGTDTTLTITWDSGSLSSEAITSVWVSLITTTNTNFNRNLTYALNEAQGANIASATTTDIGAATGNYVVVTGTTTITGLGTVQAGTRRIVEFSGILTLTHNGTSLILPGAANITTAAGDCAIFVSEGSGNWRCVSYTKASGLPVIGSVSAAAQSDQETATSTTTYVSPGRQHFHPSAPKAWGQYNPSGTPGFLGTPYNSSSITDNGVGDSTINFAVTFSAATLCGIASNEAYSGFHSCVSHVTAFSTTSIRIITTQTTATGASTGAVDVTSIGFVAFGDL